MQIFFAGPSFHVKKTLITKSNFQKKGKNGIFFYCRLPAAGICSTAVMQDNKAHRYTRLSLPVSAKIH